MWYIISLIIRITGMLIYKAFLFMAWSAFSMTRTFAPVFSKPGETLDEAIQSEWKALFDRPKTAMERPNIIHTNNHQAQ